VAPFQNLYSLPPNLCRSEKYVAREWIWRVEIVFGCVTQKRVKFAPAPSEFENSSTVTQVPACLGYHDDDRD
jgi:hypothetical protein